MRERLRNAAAFSLNLNAEIQKPGSLLDNVVVLQVCYEEMFTHMIGSLRLEPGAGLQGSTSFRPPMHHNPAPAEKSKCTAALDLETSSQQFG